VAGGGSGYGNLFGSVRFVEDDEQGRQPGTLGRESSGNRDVVPNELLSGGKSSALTSTLTASKKTAHPTSDAAAITAWKPRQTLITTVLAI
jgi:hypothetical protein